MRSLELKRLQQQRRLRRTRKTLRSISQRPRLSVFRSNRGISAQIIDDQKGQTLVAASYLELPKKGSGMTKVAMATQIGTLLAEKATKAKVTTVAFDRGSYRYHGRVKALADAARKAGLSF